MIKLAIIGSRTIKSANLDEYIDVKPDMIISGGAIGVDTLAAKYARDNNIELLEIKPEYLKYGRGAPLVRDKIIARECDKLIALWDGKSRGTMYTVRYAREIGKDVTIHVVAPSEL